MAYLLAKTILGTNGGKKPKQSWDRFDEEASREGAARSFMNVAAPSVYGRRIERCKSTMRGSSVMTCRASLINSEKQRGFGCC